MSKLPLPGPRRRSGQACWRVPLPPLLTDGDDLGEFVPDVPDWAGGDTFTTGAGRQFRILAIVSETDPDAPVMALWEVEPA